MTPDPAPPAFRSYSDRDLRLFADFINSLGPEWSELQREVAEEQARRKEEAVNELREGNRA